MGLVASETSIALLRMFSSRAAWCWRWLWHRATLPLDTCWLLATSKRQRVAALPASLADALGLNSTLNAPMGDIIPITFNGCPDKCKSRR